MALVKLYMQFNGAGFYYSGHSSNDPSGTFIVALSDGEGVYEFYTVAQDLAGNIEEPPPSADAGVVFDLTMPQSACSAAQIVNSVPFEVSFVASDADSGVNETRLWYRLAAQTQWVDSWLVETGVSGSYALDPAVLMPQWGD